MKKSNRQEARFSKNPKLYETDLAMFDTLAQVWADAGRLPSNGEKVSMMDALKIDGKHTHIMRDSFSKDHPSLTARILQQISNEAVEPSVVLAPYLETIRLSRPGGILHVPQWGGVVAPDVAEGEELPELDQELAGEIRTAPGIVGLSVKVTEEQIRFNDFDLVSRNIRAATQAIHRRKELKIANQLVKYGTVVFDNSTTGVMSTTGRNAHGSYNGTLALDDLFKVHDTLLGNGFQPDTLIVNPRAWIIFSEDSIARAFGLQRGASWSSNSNQLYRGHNQARATTVAPMFPINWNILVSPYITYNNRTVSQYPLTDIIMCDSNALGVIIDRGHGISITDFFIPERDIHKVNIKERYGISILNDGQAIGLLKNVSVARGTDFVSNLVATIEGTGINLTGDLNSIQVVTGSV